MTPAELVANWLDFGPCDPGAANAFTRQHGISLEDWEAGVVLSEQRRQERVAAARPVQESHQLVPNSGPPDEAIQRSTGDDPAQNGQYEVRYKEGANGWYQWIRTHHRPYAEGQFEALRLRPVVTEARLTQGATVLDSFSRGLPGPPEFAMKGRAA